VKTTNYDLILIILTLPHNPHSLILIILTQSSPELGTDDGKRVGQDFYYVPPGIDRTAVGMRIRRDFFDSRLQVKQYLERQPEEEEQQEEEEEEEDRKKGEKKKRKTKKKTEEGARPFVTGLEGLEHFA